MSNGTYSVEGGNLNSFSGQAQNSSGNKIDFNSQNVPGLYVGQNYTVRSGFEYITSKNPFSFSISSKNISFGDLVAGEPVTRTNTLTVSPGAASGYQVLASEDHELKILPLGASIPDTTCDSGNCSQTTADSWNSPLTYGFGYRCDNLEGNDCEQIFSKKSDSYKQFSDLSKKEAAENVMINLTSTKPATAQITYKLNISATQPAGTYQNVIYYIATPTL